MSPAKRLSRQRFRALCERCAALANGGHVTPRVARFAHALRQRDPRPRAYFDVIEALARLA